MSVETVPTFDQVWEEKYSDGHQQRYPWDVIVSFVLRNAPKGVERSQIRILEVGCGTASNLWFASREGFTVAGVDASESAIATARKRFAEDGLRGDLRVADFTDLPFEESSFDMVIDRGALTCAPFSGIQLALEEVRRVLKVGGLFFFNPYSDLHSSRAAGSSDADGLTREIDGGTLVGVGQISFLGRNQVEHALSKGWSVRSLQHMEYREMLSPDYLVHAEWRVVAEKFAK
ncbi:hypothetical protein BOW53_02180 [Solemya pervernicosa gill symbiont]|uniref:Methyltransferase domain-containing protein n=1 Tax=Solemya pervernicosa gill symbiont TaxID=642797 RepID=A0A1T2L9T8_9GAMM|nr:class I SAM-dependent methyltransferase [Solemya pervernicosa gill symbiont]OOZ41830.1 hypothetical protein BOW53_02180 [Solemya pervernicosa gill symbiont]